MLLLYCMTESGVETAQIVGVQGSEVLSVESHGVVCHFSAPANEHERGCAQDGALAFWSVVNRLFQQTTVIPFRYPTMMADETALQEFLALNGRAYQHELHRIRGLVQLKITVEVQEKIEPTSKPSSGTEYLRQRQRTGQSVAEATAAVAATGEGIVREWKKSQKHNSEILFALIERDNLAEFKARFAKLKDVSGQISFSGPWPPSEFVNCHPEVPVGNK